MNNIYQEWQAGYEAGYNPANAMYPGVIEKITQAQRAIEVDVRAKLIEQRIIFIGDAIYPQTANIVVSQLLFLQSIDNDADIKLFVNSPGGSVSAGLAIYDTMQFINCDVETTCVGLAASMGAFLLAAGAKGKRFCLPNARVMIHQPWTGGVGGQVSDVMIEAKELQHTKDTLNQILAENTGKTTKEIEEATDRNNWLSGNDAKAFGIIDDVVGKKRSDK